LVKPPALGRAAQQTVMRQSKAHRTEATADVRRRHWAGCWGAEPACSVNLASFASTESQLPVLQGQGRSSEFFEGCWAAPILKKSGDFILDRVEKKGARLRIGRAGRIRDGSSFCRGRGHTREHNPTFESAREEIGELK